MTLKEVQIRCYPKDDGDFVAWTQQLVAESRERTRSSERLLAAVQKKLRDRYPNAKVQRRDSLADVTEDGPEVWYCYRDGSWAA